MYSFEAGGGLPHPSFSPIGKCEPALSGWVTKLAAAIKGCQWIKFIAETLNKVKN